MGDLLHLHDAHEQAQQLLPWRVTGALDPAEAALIDAHLAECAECRADLAHNMALRGLVADTPLAVAPGGTRLFDRIAIETKPTRPWDFLRRRIALGWAMAGHAAVAAAAAAIVFVALAPGRIDGDYRLLGAAAGDARGNATVLFAPETSVGDMRAALDASGARMVDGPIASGAWIVHIAEAERPQALDRLRQLPQVVLAEPIDAGGTP